MYRRQLAPPLPILLLALFSPAVYSPGLYLPGLYSPGLYAQAPKAELLGSVADPAGLPLASAQLALTNLETGWLQQTTTAADGHFLFLALPPGPYALQVSCPGFATLTQKPITLRVGDRLALDLTLQLGNAAETLLVSAAPGLLQASRGTVSFHVDQQKVVTLPLDGRNFVPLLALSPGVSLPPGGLLPRINGSRPRVSEYLYDGISVLQPEPGQVAYYPVLDAVEEFRVDTNSYSAEFGRSNGGVILVNQKSGSNSLQGTLFHFFRNETLNARNLFAPTSNNAASNRAERPRFRRNLYGFVLGGPLVKNRTFFFVDWQGTRLKTGVVRTSTVPTTAQRNGQFATPLFDPATTQRSTPSGTGPLFSRQPFPENRLPLARFDAAARALAARYPAPNLFAANGAEAIANNFRRVGDDTTAADQFDGRLDHYWRLRHRLFARYSQWQEDSRPTPPLPDGSGNLTAGFLADTRTRADSLVAEHTATLSPSAVHQLRFGYTRRRFRRVSAQLAQPASLATGIPNLPASKEVDANLFSTVPPLIDIVGLQQLGPPASANARFATSVTQLLETLSFTRGQHSLKLGVDYRRQSLDALQPPSPSGNFQFTNLFTAALAANGTAQPATGNSFASFLLGQVTRFTLDAQPAPLQPRAQLLEAFVQDDWRLHSRLTLNLGLRYTLNFPSTVVGDRGAVFNLNTQRLNLLGRDGTPRSARNLEKANLGPRFGLAFRATPSLVLRAGYGLTWIEQAGITTPFTTPLFPFVQTITQQTLDNLSPAFVLSQGPSVTVPPANADSGLGQGVFAVQRDNGSGYAQQWNLTLQRTFATNWSFEVGYLGSKLTRLGVPDTNLNQLTVEQLALGAQLTQSVPNPYFNELPAHSPLHTPTIARAQLLRPFPRFTTVTLYRNNIGHSTYHSLQSRLEKRFAQGLTFTAAYTFSRLIDDAGAVFDAAILTGPVANFQAADSFNKRLEKDVSTGNIPHNFSAGFVYQLPSIRPLSALFSGWQLAGLARWQSGSPVAVVQATNLNAFAGFGIQRPNRISSPELPAAQRSPAGWFDTAAFRPAAQFTLGNSSRNPVVGPGYRALDLMLGKSFAFSERRRLELRLEAFNLTNTPPLANPNGNFGTPAFGTITSALDPRVLEIVAKLHF